MLTLWNYLKSLIDNEAEIIEKIRSAYKLEEETRGKMWENYEMYAEELNGERGSRQ